MAAPWPLLAENLITLAKVFQANLNRTTFFEKIYDVLCES